MRQWFALAGAVVLACACAACEGSFDTQAKADLSNAAMAEQIAFAQRPVYVDCRDAECDAKLPGFHRSSPDVRITMRAAGPHFVGTAAHAHGWVTWTWDSRHSSVDQPVRQ
jgi:hypothetical protein